MAQYNFLDAVMRFESGGRNIHQNVVPPGGGYNPSTGTVTGPSSASGYFQMINPTWRSAAGMAGIDTNQYPTAMSAPYDVQRQAANTLYEKNGGSDWLPYNAGLRNYVAQRGGMANFAGDNGVASSANVPNGAATGNSVDPYGFSKMNAGNMGDSGGTVSSDYGDFTDFSKGGEGGLQTGALDKLLQPLKKSKDVPKAIDQQTQRMSEAGYKNTQDTLKQEKELWTSDRATFKDYFTRAVFILVGLLALWAGLRAFTNFVPGPLETAAKVVPVARAAKKLKTAVA